MSVTELKNGAPLLIFVLSSLLASACVKDGGATDGNGGGTGSSSGSNDAPLTELEIQCDAYCQKEATLACANGTSVEACSQDCVGLGEMYASCEAQWNARNQCMTNANLSCDADGYPAVGEECFDQMDAYGQCLGSQ